ncbi:hypothetical protein R6V09_01210 [Streptomyces sp. W16]|uniref:DUF6907 domain-containing protein n=1 Tax=Streptomyces sp. W16 TaxID=3076631 RepID=UPI00295B05E9|nr:hypothetical protein [Streptomyces sp. W16]MDV9168762.1 hypothetical protein [Streptomyces sp. W16]
MRTNHAPAAGLAAVPQVSPGHRLVPATIQFFDQIARTVWIECPDWCTDDHVENPQLAVEDIVHTSDSQDFGIHTLGSPRLVFELYARITSDAYDRNPQLRQATVAVDDGDGEYAFLSPDMADDLADRLVAFASRIRQLSRTARAHQQQAGVSA